MKNIYLVLLVFIIISCSSMEIAYSGKGKTEEEKLYYMIVEDFQNGNYIVGHGHASMFENEFPQSDKLCEVLSYRGDARIEHGYINVAIEEYSHALKICYEAEDMERSNVLKEKIAKCKNKLKSK